jgi:hypothetical protein
MHRLGLDMAAPVPLDQPGRFLNWGFVQISLANFIVILLMIVVFFLALFVPFPGRRRD